MIADGCEGPSESLEPCYVPCQNIDMGWENWSEWSVCDKNNQKQRTRRCALESCVGPEIEYVSCFEANRIGKHNKTLWYTFWRYLGKNEQFSLISIW